MHSLFYTGEAIKCRGCNKEFEIHRSVVQDQERYVMALERISTRHACKVPHIERPRVRVWHTPTGRNLGVYYTREMQRFANA